MRHRLLPSIVFASTSLLAGCGGEVQDVPAPDPDAGSADARARRCEAGWPTTKGSLCTFEGGLRCCQPRETPNAPAICCEAP